MPKFDYRSHRPWHRSHRGSSSGGKSSARAQLAITCELVREALSAQHDGEELQIGEELIELHLSGCEPCATFGANLAPLSRAMRLHAFEPAPNLHSEIEASFRPQPQTLKANATIWRHPRLRHGLDWLRLVDWLPITRWAVAIVPLSIAVPALALGAFGQTHVVPTHALTPCTLLLFHHVHGG